jgi:hypothetical protein
MDPNTKSKSKSKNKEKSKGKNKSKPNVKTTKAKTTISGLPRSAWITTIIAAFTGLFVFLLGPYFVNKLNAPMTAALVNIIPNGVIMALFIGENDFEKYFKDLVFAPAFNVVLNALTYFLFNRGYLNALWAIIFEICFWFFACVFAFCFIDR